jgi:hypothetical protein
MALLGDLIAANRRLTEQLLVQVRQLDVAFNRVSSFSNATEGPAIPGLTRTAAAPWSDAITPPALAAPALSTPALSTPALSTPPMALRPGDAA